MDDLVYYHKRTRRPLEFDEESHCAVAVQYDAGWFVRTTKESVLPLLCLGDREIDLAWDQDRAGYVLPPNTDIARGIGAQSGLLTLYHRVDGERKALNPALYISPASLTEVELREILDRLGQLAFNHNSPVVAPLTVFTKKQTAMNLCDWRGQFTDRLMSRAEALCGLFAVVRRNWDLVRKKPATELKLAPSVVDLSRDRHVTAATAVQRLLQRPDLRRHMLYLPTEDLDTSENRFLAYLLRNVLLRDALPLRGNLLAEAERLRSSRKQSLESYGLRRYRSLWEKRRAEDKDKAEQLENLADNVQKIEQWTTACLLEPILQASLAKASIPMYPTARLVQSREYGAIYRCYKEYETGYAPTPSQFRLVLALEERSVHPTSNLYEIWVLLELHAMLQHVFGFEPIGQSPMDLVDVVEGAVFLPAGSTFELQFSTRDADAEQFSLLLHYTPRLPVTRCDRLPRKRCYREGVCQRLYCFESCNGKWQRSGLSPDIVLDLKARGKSYRFVIDAKYRRYQAQRSHMMEERNIYAVESVFDLDLLGTAKMKYLDALECKAAFIVHSDPDEQFTYWGESPRQPLPHRERGQQAYWPAHRFGAVRATPLKSDNLEKLLRCFFMYHADLFDICWPCRNKLTEKNDGINIEGNRRGRGDYYQCPDCGRFWIKSYCNKNSNHKLVKMGRDSFHKLTNPENEWLYDCPECGGKFNVEQQAEATGSVFLDELPDLPY